MSIETAKRFGVLTKEDAAAKKILYVMPSVRGGGEAIRRFRITWFSGEVGRTDIKDLGWDNPHSERYWLWNVEPLPEHATPPV